MKTSTGISVLLLVVSLAVTTTSHAGGQTGLRISLPFCEKASMPPAFRMLEGSGPPGFYDKRPNPCGSQPDPNRCDYSWSFFPGKYVARAPLAARANMDWGDDNVLYKVASTDCLASGPWFPGYSDAYIGTGVVPDGVIGHVHGFFNNTMASQVDGEVTLGMYYQTEPVVLALQVLQDGTWVDRSITYVSSCDMQQTGCGTAVAHVSAAVPANSDVRLELRWRPGATADQYVDQILLLTDMTLFGAECFPDAANPGMCLQ